MNRTKLAEMQRLDNILTRAHKAYWDHMDECDRGMTSPHVCPDEGRLFELWSDASAQAKACWISLTPEERDAAGL